MRVVNPATEEVIEDVAAVEGDAVDRAVVRAQAAAMEWARLPPADRSRLLLRFAAAVDGAREELARLEVLEAGHPVTSARWEADHVRDVLTYYAGAPERLAGQQIPVAGGVSVTFHEPLGVVAVIAPWNFPMTIASWGFAPALAAGNAVLVKPAEATPLTALRLASLARSAGLPAGLLQVLPGLGPVTGGSLVRHPGIRKICFTGSVPVGQSIMAECASSVKRVTLELGGKSANIVFADADIDAAADSAPLAVFDNAGQDCCARSRILVQEPVYEQFMARFEAAVKSLVVGSPQDEATQMGPLISWAHRERVSRYVSPPASPVPSSIAFRGSCPSGPGFWFPPTVLAGPSVRELPAWREEVFGPVVCVAPFSTEQEAIAIANDTPYGLSGSIWTGDVGRAIRVARAVESGNLSVNSHSSVRYNTPFGGFKSSGLGRELGPDAPQSFTETKTVFIAT